MVTTGFKTLTAVLKTAGLNVLSHLLSGSPALPHDQDSWSDLRRRFLLLEENWLLSPSEVTHHLHRQFSVQHE